MKCLCKLLICSGLCCLFVVPVQGQDNNRGQDGLRHHPPLDQLLHEMFYSNWHMPDNASVSCCNEADFYPTEIKFVDGEIYAKRREDGKYIPVPSHKAERNRDNPDGRNHLCAPPPNAFHPSDAVYCFHWEAPHEIRLGEWQDTPPAISMCTLQRANWGGLSARDRDATYLL
jgi:hypothetical protein